MRKLQQDAALLRSDMGNARRMQAEIERLREQIKSIEEAKRHEMDSLEASTEKLYEHAKWWLGMFADDGTIIRSAGELKKEVARRAEEVLALKADLRARNRFVNQLLVCIVVVCFRVHARTRG